MLRMTGCAAALAALALGASHGALAQSAVPMPATDQAANPVPPDPAKMALALKLVEVGGGEKQAEVLLKTAFAAMQKSFSQALPADQQQLQSAILEDLSQELIKLTPRLLDVSARIYAENYTEKELRDLIAFQSSESGQSMLRKSPTVRAEIITQTIPLTMALIPDLARKTADKVCAQKHCTEQQRQTVAEAMTRAFKAPTS